VKPTTGQGINPGAMREQVQLQQRTTQQSSSGAPLPVWNVFATVRAEVMRLPGREVYASAERNARVPTTWKLRWLDGVTPDMRLINRNKVFNIKSAIDPTGRREELLVTAEELTGETP
jgi:SPP1 family predicted phage head-tail adaptor